MSNINQLDRCSGCYSGCHCDGANGVCSCWCGSRARREAKSRAEIAERTEPITGFDRGSGPMGLTTYIEQAFEDRGYQASDDVCGAISLALAIGVLDSADAEIEKAIDTGLIPRTSLKVSEDSQ